MATMSPIATLTDFIDSIKEKLTDGEYIEGMNMCKKVFDKKERENPLKLYRMTYLRPYMFMDEHCENEDCDDMKYCLSFERATSLVQLTDRGAARIRETNLFLGDKEEMSAFIDVDVFHSFPNEFDENMEWYEFPVMTLERVDPAPESESDTDVDITVRDA
jgi:hypothetical protein